MRKRKLKIFLTPTENSIVIQSLNHLRNALLRENRDTGCLDELLLKVMCAPVKKMQNYISLLNEPLILFRKSKRLFWYENLPPEGRNNPARLDGRLIDRIG